MAMVIRSRCIAETGSGQCKNVTTKGLLCPKHLKERYHLAVKKSNIEDAGLGLFTTIDRKKGDLITYYTGIPLTEQEKEESNSLYVYEPEKGLYIDARRTDEFGYGRYLNDARDVKLNNCNLFWNRKTKTTAVKATKNIKAGSELYWSYGPSYWKRSRKKKKIPTKSES